MPVVQIDHNEYAKRGKIPVKSEAEYIARQNLLRKELPKYEQVIRDKYAQYSDALQQEAEVFLTKKLTELSKSLEGDEMIAISLVDLQRGFSFANFGLQAPGGENVILTNAALLDALIKVSHKHPNLMKKLELIVTQDAHLYDREKYQNPDDAKIIKQAFPDEALRDAHTLNENNELTKVYGQHCIIGTPDVGLPYLIEEKLHTLQSRVKITRFGKMTFGPGSALKLIENIDISDLSYFQGKNSIFDAKGVAYEQYMKKFKHVLLTGICSDVCVQEAAIFLAEKLGVDVEVLDAFVHQLVLPHLNQTYESVLEQIEQAYSDLNTQLKNDGKLGQITFTKFGRFRSNPELLPAQERAERFVLDTGLYAVCDSFTKSIKKIAYNDEMKATSELLESDIQTAIDHFVRADNTISFENRRKGLLTAIQTAVKTAEPVLGKHPQWKTLAFQFLSLIASVLTLFVLNTYLDRSVLSLFSPKTNSMQQAEALTQKTTALLTHSFYAADLSALDKKETPIKSDLPALTN